METEPPGRRDAALLFPQVLTTLAQAAATAVRAVGMPSVDYDSWSKVILENRRHNQ